MFLKPLLLLFIPLVECTWVGFGQSPFKRRRRTITTSSQRHEVNTAAVTDIVATTCATRRIPKAQSETKIQSGSPLLGQWVLDEGTSESLTPFLKACGAPSFMCPMFAKSINKLNPWIQLSDRDSKLSIKYRQRREQQQQDGFQIPSMKLQTDAEYSLDSTTNIQIGTPRGPQQVHVEDATSTNIRVVRDGPATNERVVEEWTFQPESKALILDLLHVCPKKKETRVKRVFLQQSNS